MTFKSLVLNKQPSRVPVNNCLLVLRNVLNRIIRRRELQKMGQIGLEKIRHAPPLTGKQLRI